MGRILDFGRGVREVVWLGSAEQRARAYDESVLHEVRREKAKARARLKVSRCIVHPTSAISELAHATTHALRASHLLVAGHGAFDAAHELDRLEREGIDVTVARWALSASASTQLDFASAEERRDALDAFVYATLRSIDARTPSELVALRYGRVIAIGLMVALLAYHWLAANVFVHNVALNKPVTVSGLNPASGPASGVVDGRTRGTFGVHTSEMPHPFVAIDLGHVYSVRRVRVFNRGDGWFDDVLPLSLELSEDGSRYHEVARRTEHFDVWDVPLDRAPARWVRVTKDNGYITLNEIEVFARE